MKYWRKPLNTSEVHVARGKVYIVKDRCKGCGFCVEFCPRKILKMSDEFNAKGYHPPKVIKDECANCHLCELLCPEFAIFSLYEGEVTPDEESAHASRP